MTALNSSDTGFALDFMPLREAAAAVAAAR